MNTILSKCAFACLLMNPLFCEHDNGFCSQWESELVDMQALEDELCIKAKESVVVRTKQIHIEGYPKAFNPSIIKVDGKTLLIFRNVPDTATKAYISETGALWLDENFDPISSPQLLITRKPGDPTPQQSEDARVFLWKGEPYIIYNDNVEMVNPPFEVHRDMFIAKLNYTDGRFSVGEPQKFIHCDNYPKVTWQKNWQPFDWQGELLISYTINPHEILYPDFETGVCYPALKTKGDITWHWGKLRGGALAQMVDGQYLAFFHSPVLFISGTTQGRTLMHYFMGAYTFSAEPPFNLTSMSPYPIVAEGFYTPSPIGIRCVYPGGFVYDDTNFYVAYGKDDHEVWIAVIDKQKLYKSLQPVKEVDNSADGVNEGH